LAATVAPQSLDIVGVRGGAGDIEPKKGMKHTLKVGAFFMLWYIFNIGEGFP
jgi:hypothetical protein